MRRHVDGLHSKQDNYSSNVEGRFLVRVQSASYRWHPQKPFLALEFVILEPSSLSGRSFSGRLYFRRSGFARCFWSAWALLVPDAK